MNLLMTTRLGSLLALILFLTGCGQLPSGCPPECSELDLRQGNLSGLNLEEANLKGAVIMDSQLRGVKLNGADLSGANLAGSYLLE